MTFRMILLSLTLVCGLLTAQTDSVAVRAEHQKVEQDFEQIFANMARFFERKQKMIYKGKLEQSASGYIAYVVEYTCKKVSYQISSTDNPQSPYEGTISLQLTRRDNRSCGDTKGTFALGPPEGWSSIETALSLAGSESCFKTTTRATEHGIDLVFGHSDGLWMFMKARNQSDGKADPQLSLAFGRVIGRAMEITDEAARQFNLSWQKLLSPEGVAKQ